MARQNGGITFSILFTGLSGEMNYSDFRFAKLYCRLSPTPVWSLWEKRKRSVVVNSKKRRASDAVSALKRKFV